VIIQNTPWRDGISRRRIAIAAALALSPLWLAVGICQPAPPGFSVLAIAERGGLHQPFVDAAKVWLAREAQTGGFTVEYVEDPSRMDAASLSKYRLIIQLNYPPYKWGAPMMAAFQKYIEEGRGGWVGFHHATLLGEFDGYPMWPWFSEFMGGIRFAGYIATFASGKVTVEAPSHPVMKGSENVFTVDGEEWYTYDKSPRPNVRVLASVDEKTYSPPSTIRMGDHPVIWTNERMKARNIYFQMGHRGELFQNPNFTKIFHNSILWAVGP
jgi:uncharacterized protein